MFQARRRLYRSPRGQGGCGGGPGKRRQWPGELVARMFSYKEALKEA